MIKLVNISVGYESPLLHSEELQLNQGQIYVLIGKNGAGKTTLFNSIIGLRNLIDGSIEIENSDISKLNSGELAKKISFVPANFPIVDYIRVIDFVALGRSPYTNHFGHLNIKDTEVIEDTLNLLGISHLRNDFITEISDGQRQLVSIAKALAQETPVLLLDEPLAYLDFSNRRELLKKLSILAKEKNKCIVFSSHDIDVSHSEDFNYLLIEDKNKKVQLYTVPSRDEIINICFPE